MKFGVLQITGTDGRRRDLPLDLPSLVVGRADGNAIIIDDLSISRRHARLTVDSGHLLVEDLGSAQGTFVNGVRIEPHVPNLVEDDAELRFGDIEVRFEPPPPVDIQLQPGAVALPGDLDAARGEDLAVGARLGVTLVSPNAPVIAGAPWMASVRIHNRSKVVDRVRVSVPDLPGAWVRIDRPELALAPGASETIQLTIIPPRKAESLAGDYDFTVLVSSHEYQREAATLGRFTLAPFENLSLTFEAPRSKRDFVLVTENRGNQAAAYTLQGEDPEAAHRFEFELPAVVLQPGERRTVGLRVHHKTPLFGVPVALGFNVHAESDGPEGQKVTALGQLALRPPLQKFRAPAMFVAAIGVIAVVFLAVVLLRSDSVVTSANAEAKFSGVHMCDKDAATKAQARQKQEDAAVPKATGASSYISGSDPGAPFFAQNDPRWGKDEYARAKDPEFGPDWCGSTIEQCGCAMTSVATTMAIFGLLTMPDGSPLTPQAMNSWFNQDAKKTNRGWVSRGYIYGDVIWTAANQLSGEMAKARPGTPTVRFSRTGNGNEDEIREQLKQGRPIILEVPGHWIAAVGLDPNSGAILINDPYYRDRTALDVYKGKVKSSVIFEPSDDLSAVVFSVPSDVRVRITDKQGRVFGSLAKGSAEDAAKDATGATNQIPGASYSTRQAWRDPSCVESAPPPDAGTNQIILPGTADDYKIEVLDASGKPTSIAIHTYDKQGKSSVQTIDNPGSAVAQLSVDPAT
ncbi:MAG: FHA domain-containing protein, partial [Anaerolineaceae bacterium]